MTSTINELKKLAKRYARAARLPQHKALDFIATELDFPHWRALQRKVKSGWLPPEEALVEIRRHVAQENPLANGSEDIRPGHGSRFGNPDEAVAGTIGSHPYKLYRFQDDVHMEGEGWTIVLPEAPNAAPSVEIDERHAENCPVNDPAFLQAALDIANAEAKKIQARIASDWSRRSTKPDAKGVVRHPLFDECDGRRIESNVWHCLHCNGKISGEQIAKNLWHCPACGASPINIYSTPFWLGDGDEKPKPIQSPVTEGRREPIIEVIDKGLRLDLDAEKIALLIRSALLDDATNISERLGALMAEISVGDEGDVCISFEVDYWPEAKEPVQALAVAEALGIRIDLEVMLTSPPFAWPGIGELTTNTLEYTKLMLKAYEEHASLQDDA